MQTPHLTHAHPRAHPMLIIAAVAVILFCLVGTAAILGWIPSSIGGSAARSELSEFDRTVLASKLAQGETASAPALAALPEPAQRPAGPLPRKSAPVQLAANDPVPARNWCSNCGNIESVREISHRAQGSGLGAAGGAVLGGLLGNQVGSGSGRQLATVAGAVGGAVVGNQVEGNMKASRSYEIRVRLDDGGVRTFSQKSIAGWRTGDRVKIVNGSLRSAS